MYHCRGKRVFFTLGLYSKMQFTIKFASKYVFVICGSVVRYKSGLTNDTILIDTVTICQ